VSPKSTEKLRTEWKAGSKVQQEDWNRGDKVDYRQNHNYVLANQDGMIVSVRQAPHDH
jgi:hypothetical protein